MTPEAARADARLARWLVAPAALVVCGVALVPAVATAWEALHRHDLRLPWLGRPFVGAGNFMEAVGDPRFLAAVWRTLLFVAVSVPLELAFGLGLALVLQHLVRGRGPARVVTLLPWAVPTVVAALAWRFAFETSNPMGIDWLTRPLAAWVPIVLADVWKTTPFVAVLLLAGLHGIDPALHDAARVDGASPPRQLLTITLPLLRPALIVAAAFRTLDALRLFDLPYVITAGGPGTATEPLSLYAFVALMQRLRIGYGSALSIAIFLLALVVAVVAVRALGRVPAGERS